MEKFSQHPVCFCLHHSTFFSWCFFFSFTTFFPSSWIVKKTIIKMKKEKVLLLISVLIGLWSVSQGEVFEVKTVEQLINAFDYDHERTITVDFVLLSDIDFSQSRITQPLGTLSNSKCVTFNGVFNGNGHSIKGLRMNYDGYVNVGLFCSLENATIENLVIDSSCSFTGYNAGALSAISSSGRLN